jgi:hypothetical protein
MSEPVLSMDVRHPTDSVAVIDIKGEVTAACEPTLMKAYEEASSGDTKLLVLNFDGLDYMNSGGIGMLVTLPADLRADPAGRGDLDPRRRGQRAGTGLRGRHEQREQRPSAQRAELGTEGRAARGHC